MQKIYKEIVSLANACFVRLPENLSKRKTEINCSHLIKKYFSVFEFIEMKTF